MPFASPDSLESFALSFQPRILDDVSGNTVTAIGVASRVPGYPQSWSGVLYRSSNLVLWQFFWCHVSVLHGIAVQRYFPGWWLPVVLTCVNSVSLVHSIGKKGGDKRGGFNLLCTGNCAGPVVASLPSPLSFSL